MKRICLYIVSIMCLIFVIPFTLTSKFQTFEVSNSENNQASTKDYFSEDNSQFSTDRSPYNYKEYGTIKLKNASNDEVSDINLDEYLVGVVSAEMPANFELEALKAQAVVARTYTLYTITNNKGKHGDGVICSSSSCCQAWLPKEERLAKWDEDVREQNWAKIEEAVYSTKGQVIEYNGKVIDAFFHSNSGGKTELPVNVWGGTDFPYLKVVETAGEDAYSQYSSQVEFSKKDFENKLKEKYKDFSINWSEADAIKIIEYNDSGRVRTIKIGNKNLSGVEARSLFGLKSANFECKIENESIKFSVIGYGHGVGLSQTGADSLAKNGANYKDIILHFYANVEIVSM